MSERLPVKKSEYGTPGEVFDAIAAIRAGAKTQRAAYQESMLKMNEVCKQLRGVEVLLTGQLHGRGGTRVYADDPSSKAERLHVRIGSVRIEDSEAIGEGVTRHLPFIDLTAWTIEGNELICARLGVGEFGVSAELIESSPVQT